MTGSVSYSPTRPRSTTGVVMAAIGGWKEPGTALRPYQVKQTVKHGGGNLMAWGAFMANGVGGLALIENRMNAALYCKILREDLKHSLRDLGTNVEEAILCQDNDPKHMSKMAQGCLDELDLNVLLWPSQSPDLNPIEHLWCYLKQHLATYERMQTSVHELWERVQHEWFNIPTSYRMKLVAGMPARIQTVLDAKGGYTKY